MKLQNICDREKKNLILIYILYLSGALVPLFPLIGVVMAYINKDISEGIFSSHYIYLLRTFYIGFIILVICSMLVFIVEEIFLYALLVVWLVVRVVVGLKNLVDNKPIRNPDTYLI